MVGPSILLVEDDPVSARLTTLALAEIGAAVTTVTSGASAIASYAQGEWDMILMDLHLTDSSGLMIVEHIRQIPRYQQRPVPCIALTSNALMTDKASFLKNTGFSDYLTKPIRPEVLVSTLRRHLPAKKQAV